MSNLPHDGELPLAHLMKIFGNTSASYKFLLFGALLNHLEKSEERYISFEDLAISSMSFAWYSIHFYKLNFGVTDRMTLWVRGFDQLIEEHLLVSEHSMAKIHEALQTINKEGPTKAKKALHKFIREFSALVPYRLISPWFQSELKNLADTKRNRIIVTLSHKQEYKSLYKIHTEPKLILELDRDWFHYLRTHLGIIKGWWKFHFVDYLQKKNPTVLSLATKLQPPIERNMNDVKKLFKNFYQESKQRPECFYTGSKLEVISHDHFLPWSFLGSDPIYNFVPTSNGLNSSKGNQIPSRSYLQPLGDFQYQVFDYLRTKQPRNSLIESYLNDCHLSATPDRNEFCQKLISLYAPLFVTAENQGFSGPWVPSSQ